ncbi:hypothetical protein ATO6_10120 [Oceanicola sp. 22II-s10i]|nr:hypothetical protein ATO6_10120 [Oceanicola sp. 22II-s10i]
MRLLPPERRSPIEASARDRTKRDGESGVVLINVLVIIALASTVVYLMLSRQEVSLDRVARMAEAAETQQLALGAEASVIDALYRDLQTAPDTDHFREPWAAVIQDEVQLPTGRFSVRVEDVQAKYDVNLLGSPGIGSVEMMGRLLAALDQPPDLARRMAAVVRRAGPLADLSDLAAFGIPDATIVALEPYVTALPTPGTVNLNTVSPLLLETMLRNRSIALRLISTRDRTGQITRDDITGAGGIRPENSGFTSGVFDVFVTADVGGASMTLQTRLLRTDPLNGLSVRVLRRRIVPGDAGEAD